MITATRLTKSYRRHAETINVLQGIDLELLEGEFLSMVGASGSGKSTLMHLLGTLDSPDQGEIRLHGKRIDTISARERDQLRNQTFGFIFQFYHLLPELTALQNVMMPAMVGSSVWNWRAKKVEARDKAIDILERVGLGHRLKHKSKELSGGEMQRVAVARALVMKPKVLFADEPTGNLDTNTGMEIIRLLHQMNREERVTILMVTHNLDLVKYSQRVLRMTSGKIVEEKVLGDHPELLPA